MLDRIEAGYYIGLIFGSLCMSVWFAFMFQSFKVIAYQFGFLAVVAILVLVSSLQTNKTGGTNGRN